MDCDIDYEAQIQDILKDARQDRDEIKRLKKLLGRALTWVDGKSQLAVDIASALDDPKIPF